MLLVWLALQNFLLRSRPHSLSAKTKISTSKQIEVATFLSGEVDFDYFNASFQEIGSKLVWLRYLCFSCFKASR